MPPRHDRDERARKFNVGQTLAPRHLLHPGGAYPPLHADPVLLGDSLVAACRPTELTATPVKYFPTSPTLDNFRLVFQNPQFQRALINSTIVALSVTTPGAGRRSVRRLCAGAVQVQGADTGPLSSPLDDDVPADRHPRLALPDDQPVRALQPLGSLVLTYLVFTLPFTVWVLTSFFRQLPAALEEAAYVDGATPFQTFYKVLLPLAGPGLVTTGLLAFIGAWNEFLFAVSFTQTPEHRTVPPAIANFAGTTGSGFEVPWGSIMAATVIVTVPIVVLVLIFQRKILAGLTAGAVKG